MTNPKQDEQQIRAVIDTWGKATAAGDLPTLMNLMTDDVTFLTPGNPPMHRADFANSFQSMIYTVRVECRTSTREITVEGDLAICWNYLEVEVAPIAGGQVMKRAGNALTVFRRGTDGQWRVWRDGNLVVAG